MGGGVGVRIVTVLLTFREAGRVGSRNGIQESVCLNKNVTR